MMCKTRIIATAWLLGVAGMYGPGSEALAQHQVQTCPLSDGVLLKSAQGNLVKHVNEPSWSFLLKYDSMVGQTKLKAGMRFPLLRNAVYAAMLTDRQQHANATYWLWARVTRYRDNNYLFPLNFMPLQEAAESTNEAPGQSEDSPPAKADEDQTVSDTQEDSLAIPAFIRERRKGQTVVRSRDTQVIAEIKPNQIVLDRMGFIQQHEDGVLFVYDGLGQNRQATPLRLLPCALLESVENQQARSPERLYFRVTGIQTQYDEQAYLLLRRATRAYSHGNFKR